MNWLNASTLGSMIPIFGMLIPIVAIIGGVVQHMRSEAQRHETIRTLARAGQPIPLELLKHKGHDQDQAVGEAIKNEVTRPRTGNGSLKVAIILISLGLGLAACLYLLSPDGWIWGTGLIPTFLGVGFLFIWRIESKPSVTPTSAVK
jgi:hypothetical protein